MSAPILHLESRIPSLLSLVVKPVAVTLGRHIFVRRGIVPTEQLLRHEATHVAQAAELGLLRFLLFYAWDWLRAWWVLRDGAAAYRAIRFEQEARDSEDFDMPWQEIGEYYPGAWRTYSLPPKP